MVKQKSFGLAWALAACASVAACRKHAPPAEEPPMTGTILADTGFRPGQHGYKFENTGGQYPRTPPVLTAAGVVKLFGKDACVGGDDKSCKLTPAAAEWMGVINRKMNIGQCEGMAVSSLAFFKKLADPAAFQPGAASAHDLTHASVGPLIGYYWAWQTLNPVLGTRMRSLVTQTPTSVEDTLVDMMKRGELATVAFFSDHGGHAVTPYAVEDRGGGVHWIRIYDNNWPDKDRYIVIDRNANTWKYELASLNPEVPKAAWAGTAESHTIGVIPLNARLGKPECPFCAGGAQKVVVPSGANAVSLTNQDGQRVGREGDKVVNEIPGASVVRLDSYLEGAPEGEPIYVVPAEGDYDVHLHGQDRRAAEGPPDDDHGVCVLGNGSAVAVETPKLKDGDKDTLSLARDGRVRYHSASGGTIPPIRLAHDGGGSGMSARIANMKAEAHDEIELRMDHQAGTVTVGGGGKKSDAYDLKVKHVHAGADDHEVEQKGIKFKPGEAHTIHTDPRPGAKPAPFKIHSARYVRPEPRPAGSGAAHKDPPKPAPAKPQHR